MIASTTTEPPSVPSRVPPSLPAHRLTRRQQRSVTVSALRLGAAIMTSVLLVRAEVGLLGGVVLAWLVLSSVAVTVGALLHLVPVPERARRLARRWALPEPWVEPVVAALDTVAFVAVAALSPAGYQPVAVLGLVLLGQAPLTWGCRGIVLVVPPLTVVALVDPAGLFENVGGRVALVVVVAAIVVLALALRRVLVRQAAVADQVQATLSMVFDHSPAPALLTCVTGTVLEVNTAAVRLCGREPDHLLGRKLVDLVHPDDTGAMEDVMASVLSDGASGGTVTAQPVEVRLESAGGTRWVRLLVGMVPGGAGVVAQLVVQVEDVEERRATAARLQHEATHDALTGLPNRRAVQRDLERLTAGAGDRGPRPGGAGGALVLLDLDGFKEVNDALGHGAGDDLLVVAADRLRSSLHAGEEAGRLAGDELVVLAGEVEGDQAAHDLGRRVLDGLLGPAHLDAGEVELRASAGVRRIAAGGDDAASVMRDADAALYRAKRSGGCRLEMAEVPEGGAQGGGADPGREGRRYSA